MKRKKKEEPLHPLSLAIPGGGRYMPHELDPDDFLVWMIEQGMTEDDYQRNIKRGDDLVALLKKGFSLAFTSELTHDQKGWAKADWGYYFNDASTVWMIDPKKPSRPTPAPRFERN